MKAGPYVYRDAGDYYVPICAGSCAQVASCWEARKMLNGECNVLRVRVCGWLLKMTQKLKKIKSFT